jgi:hypothetical protein
MIFSSPFDKAMETLIISFLSRQPNADGQHFFLNRAKKLFCLVRVCNNFDMKMSGEQKT